jgi:hypothetical protein
LTEGQEISIPTYLKNANSGRSQLTVFTELSRKFRNLQRQLHTDYNPDRLGDQILKSADLPERMKSMREKPPETSHAAEEWIAALLSSQTGSASAAVFVCVDKSENDYAAEVNYGSGRRFGDAAK